MSSLKTLERDVFHGLYLLVSVLVAPATPCGTFLDGAADGCTQLQTADGSFSLALFSFLMV